MLSSEIIGILNLCVELKKLCIFGVDQNEKKKLTFGISRLQKSIKALEKYWDVPQIMLITIQSIDNMEKLKMLASLKD